MESGTPDRIGEGLFSLKKTTCEKVGTCNLTQIIVYLIDSLTFQIDLTGRCVLGCYMGVLSDK